MASGTGFLAGPDGDAAKHLSWTYDHWEDIVSDLSAFHRIDDVAALTITKFLMLAVRLSAYSGALRSRFTQPNDTAGTASLAAVPVTASTTSGGGDGDTPDEVIRQIKLAQFAQRHGANAGEIEWNDREVLRELTHG